MKFFISLMVLTSLFTGSAFAVGETSTDCPWMKEENSRNNPKENMGSKQAQAAKVKSVSTSKQ